MKKIFLPHGKYTIVDDEDFEWLNQWKWHCRGGYACRTINIKTDSGRRTTKYISMHREILGVAGRSEVDHRDLDKLNNTKSNLRVSSRSENMMNQGVRKDNRSGYKGIRQTKYKTFEVRVCSKGKSIQVGTFRKLEDAIIAHSNAVKIYHGEFSRPNCI